MKSIKSLLFLFLCILFIFNSCKEDYINPFILKQAKDYNAEVATSWLNLHLKLVKETPGFTPPVVARSFGYAGLNLYESMVEGSRDKRSFSTIISHFSRNNFPKYENGNAYHWPLVANASMAQFYRNFFKTASAANKLSIDSLETIFETLYSSKSENENSRSIQYGRDIANAMYEYSKSDNQDEAYNNNFPKTFIPPVFPGAWVPTNPNVPIPLQPYWGDVRTFSPLSVLPNIIPGHLPYSTDKNSLFYLEGLETYLYAKNLTEEQKIIAQYWSDDPGLTATPPGHSVSIALQLIENDNVDLGLASEIIAKVGMAVHDAFVSCWKCKYTYNLLRPVTYIKDNIDPSFTTLLSTPPFPEHTSGHSVQTSSAVTVLQSYFENNKTFVDKTHVNATHINGTPRTFISLTDLAEEAAISRLFGGIHYRTAIELGITQGKKIGSYIVAMNVNK